MWIFAPDSVKRKGITSDFYLSFLLVSVGSGRMGLLLLQMFIKPKEGGDKEESCHDPCHRSPKQTPVHARAGTSQRLTPHLAIISITPLSIERLL